MRDQLTKNDIKKIEEEIEYRKLVVRKEAIEAVKEARAQGDLSENFEYYAAKKDYVVYRELAGGKGFADIVFIPRKKVSKPAIIVELKWDKTAETAIQQIKERKYTDGLRNYSGEVLLVGINYDAEGKDNKHHTCIIEEWN